MMKRIIWVTLLVFSLLLFGLSAAQAHGHHSHKHGHKKPMKKGILLVAFGSSYPQAQASFENIEDQVKKTFPDIPVSWAYTSKIIRHKMAEEGKNLDSVAVALAKMMDKGFTHVAVQSLHTISGAEFHDLQTVVNGFESMNKGLERILVGYPLLAKHKDLVQVRKNMLENIPTKRQKDQAVILMGHGTHHPSNAFYAAMAYEFQKEDPNVYVGTVEESPTLEDIITELKAKGTKKAYLMPFMSVAGDHVRNDMAGDGPDSWKSILENEGIEAEAILKGTAEYDNMVSIWIDHLKGPMNHF